MRAPFEGVFGNSSELRVIQFMLPYKGSHFNISELARGTGITRPTLAYVVRKLAKWNVLKVLGKHGNANYYALNEDSGFVEVFENLDNRIIEQMLGEEELARIANYSLEHIEIFSQENPTMNAVGEWVPADWQEGAGQPMAGGNIDENAIRLYLAGMHEARPKERWISTALEA